MIDHYLDYEANEEFLIIKVMENTVKEHSEQQSRQVSATLIPWDVLAEGIAGVRRKKAAKKSPARRAKT